MDGVKIFTDEELEELFASYIRGELTYWKYWKMTQQLFESYKALREEVSDNNKKKNKNN